jgi:IrrE N-terminal-like domain
MRAAGDGMAWPDLTIVPEGSVTCLRWSVDREPTFAPVRFLSADIAFVDSAEVVGGLAGIVTSVLERLAEEGLQKTRLASAWAELGHLDEEEKSFCVTAARLGIDPFSVADDLAGNIVDAASLVGDDVAGDFFDSADAHSVIQAARWTRRASSVAVRASSRAASDLRDLYRAVPESRSRAGSVRAWERGYSLARGVREMLQIADESPVDISQWLGIGAVRDDSGGLQGLAVVDDDRCGLVLGERRLSKRSRTFWCARALGRTLVQPGRRTYLLSSAGSDEERVARAFAAELLSPASGIRKVLDGLGREDEDAFEAVADRFGVSPVVVRHQYDNQLARTSS